MNHGRVFSWNNLNIGGISQSERLPKALTEGYIRAQERSLAERLNIIHEISASIPFYDESNTIIGNWSLLFSSEPALKLLTVAKLVAINPPNRILRFNDLVESDVNASIKELHNLAHQLNNCLSYYQPKERAGYTVAKHRYPSLEKIIKSFEYIEDIDDLNFTNTSDFIRYLISEENGAVDPIGMARNARRSLISHYSKLINLVSSIEIWTTKLFNECLTSGKLDPSLGLIITQLKLLIEVENHTNDFTNRHNKFYYEDLLKQSRKTASPPSALIRFETTKNPVELNADTILTAQSTDAQTTLNFNLNESMRIAPLKIENVFNLKFVNSYDISPQSQLGFCSGVRTHKFDFTEIDNSSAMFDPISAPDTEFGIQIKSPIFFLSQGERKIDLKFNFRRRQETEDIQNDETEAPLDNRASTNKPTSKKVIANCIESESALLQSFELTTVDRILAFLTTAENSLRQQHAEFSDEFFDQVFENSNAIVERHVSKERNVNSGSINNKAFIKNISIGAIADWILNLRKHVLSDSENKHCFLENLRQHFTHRSARELIYLTFFHGADTNLQLSTICGKFVTAVLLEASPWPLNKDDRRTYVEKALKVYDKKAVIELARSQMFNGNKAELFQYLLGDAFYAELTTESGVQTFTGLRTVATENEDDSGIEIGLDLTHSVPAIVPGENELVPALAIKVSNEFWSFPFTILENFVFESVDIKTRVTGLKKLIAFSDEGPLDTSQPILPFGARPNQSSEVLIGSEELARKPVSHIALNINWGDLPTKPGGFETYYGNYGPSFNVPDPYIHVSYLMSGETRSLTNEPVPMVEFEQPDEVFKKRRRIVAKIPGKLSYEKIEDDNFQEKQSIRNGLVRLVLDCPEDCFGHEPYPLIMARSMRPKLISFKPSEPPRPPYTPKINSASLDYIAKTTIQLNAPERAHPEEKIIQLGIFGSQEIFPSKNQSHVGFFPEKLGDGTLFIQISGQHVLGLISILFVMKINTRSHFTFKPEPLIWHYLTETGWKPLPNSSLVSDSTEGLMRSGVVSLHLPKDAAIESTSMPNKGAWVAVSTNEHLDAYPRLESVHMNGAIVTSSQIVPKGTKFSASDSWALASPNPNVSNITQVSRKSHTSGDEDKTAFRARISENLRHRQKAVTPWDYERLVLENFPEVWKVKCFPTLDRRYESPRPGAMTVVAVPYPDDVNKYAESHMHDVLTLRRIEKKLRKYSSPFAKIEVRNPSFERVQVRAKVGFTGDRNHGALINKLKLEISKYLSVWTAPKPRDGFGWSVNLNDVGAHILGLEYVNFITDFSLLQLTSDDHNYHTLIDTADTKASNQSSRILAKERWSLILPMEDHWITAIASTNNEPPKVTGISELRMGRNFIIRSSGEKNDHPNPDHS